MKIHFYINTSFPYGMAAAKRRLCYAKGLMAAGQMMMDCLIMVYFVIFHIFMFVVNINIQKLISYCVDWIIMYLITYMLLVML